MAGLPRSEKSPSSVYTKKGFFLTTKRRGTMQDDFCNQDKIAIKIELDNITKSVMTDRLVIFSRLIAQRFHFQQPVLKGDEVYVVRGGFYPVGGTLHRPTVCPLPGTAVVAEGVDCHLGRMSIEREPHIYSEVPHSELKILKLEDERERLNMRIVIINNELQKRCLVKEALENDWRCFSENAYGLDAEKTISVCPQWF
jgi:hypothetical protein